jgi:transcriptional regulator with XRE-family HTH domain
MPLVAKKKQTKRFGEMLRELREARGLTQAELGERAGMAYQTIAKYERGASEPIWTTVTKLADALGVSVAEFRDEPE